MKAFLSLVCLSLTGTVVLSVPVQQQQGDQFNGPELRRLALGKANDDFGLALLDRLEQQRKSPEDNVLISPFSISTVLAMVLAGANASTHDQVFKSLRLQTTTFTTEAELFSAFHSLLASVGGLFSKDDPKQQLTLANSVAVQRNFAVLKPFMDTVTEQFDATVFAEDFQTKAHEATQAINQWVSQHTNGKIEKLFSSDLDQTTVMVLLNAVYFHGTWHTRFEKQKTVAGKFQLSEAKSVDAPMMHVMGQFRSAVFDDGQMVELPYTDSLSMLIYLPDEAKLKATSGGNVAKLFAEGGSMRLAQRIASLRNHTVAIQLPRFKVESDLSLSHALQSLGMTDAFHPNVADFSRIDGKKDLFISEVRHKTFVEVSEEGTEAAAATGAVVNVRAMPMHVEFVVDRPFLFAIRDSLHQVTLFAGVVNKP